MIHQCQNDLRRYTGVLIRNLGATATAPPAQMYNRRWICLIHIRLLNCFSLIFFLEKKLCRITAELSTLWSILKFCRCSLFVLMKVNFRMLLFVLALTVKYITKRFIMEYDPDIGW